MIGMPADAASAEKGTQMNDFENKDEEQKELNPQEGENEEKGFVRRNI